MRVDCILPDFLGISSLPFFRHDPRYSLIFFPILAFLLVVENAEIAFIAGFADVMILHGLQDGAARFVAVRTIVETAAGREFEDFGEIMGDFHPFHFDGAETFDARRVDQVAAFRQRDHFGEGSGVHAFVVVFGDVARAQVYAGYQFIDNRRLADARMTRQEGDFVFQLGLQGVQSFAGGGAEFQTGIADGGIEVDEALQIFLVFPVIPVDFVENQFDGYAIGFGRGQEAVDKHGGGNGVIDGYDQHRLVEVGGDDVRLLRQVGGAADDVVFPLFNRGDKGCALFVDVDLHPVAHGYGVGGADVLEAEIAFYLTFDLPPVVGPDGIPATCVFNY